MPEACQVCGENEFECDDGLYFCRVCSTQSQNYIMEEVEEVFGTSARSYKRPKQKTKDKDSEVVEEIRPWVTSEGFTILLRQQVNSLIKLGASPNLKDIVLKLWAFYLKKMSLGFGSEMEESKHYGKYSRCNFVPTYDKPKPVDVGKRLTRSKSRADDRTQVEEQQALHSAFGAEDFYEEDNPLAAPQKEFKEVDMFMEDEEKQQQQQDSGKHKRRHEAFRMTLPNSLAFCYIGLQYTNNQVLLYDLIKAVKLGLVPYNNGPEIFPADMKLNGSDWDTFCVAKIPSVQYLRSQTIRICVMIDVIPLPRPDITLLTLRFVLAMNLPGNLHGLIRTLLRKHEPMYGGAVARSIPGYGMLAMAYVIVAVKLLFGIDDDTEDKLSSFTEELTELLGTSSDIKLFSWSEWTKDQDIRTGHSPIPPEDWRSIRTWSDTDNYCKAFKHQIANRAMTLRSNEEKNRENITEIFKRMCSQFDNLSTAPLEHRNNEQSKTATDSLEPNEALGQAEQDGVPEDLSDKYGYTDYTQHCMQHLTDWDGFIDQLQLNQVDSDSLIQKLDKLSESHVKASENYVFYENKADLEHCHKSYRYLLGLALPHIGCNESLLHYYVQNLEIIYFKQGRNALHKYTSLRFRQFYFSQKMLYA